MNLSHEDIQAILKILDDTPYDELNLDYGRFSLHLKRDGSGDWVQWTRTLPDTSQQDTTAGESATPEESGGAESEEPPPSESGLVDIRSPMVGTFYRSPKPGAPPFVEIGSAVEQDTVIAIIEVMKLMNSIPAKISGEVREILVSDAQPVEKGQLLMRVKPS